jgi:hypothetical protein
LANIWVFQTGMVEEIICNKRKFRRRHPPPPAASPVGAWRMRSILSRIASQSAGICLARRHPQPTAANAGVPLPLPDVSCQAPLGKHPPESRKIDSFEQLVSLARKSMSKVPPHCVPIQDESFTA